MGKGEAPAPRHGTWTAADVMTRSVVTMRSTDGIRGAAQKLVLDGIGGAPVELGGTVLGFVTLMDLNRALSGRTRRGRWWKGHRSTASGTVADVRSLEVDIVRPETPLADVLDVMDDRDVERVLVVEGRQVVGVVTATDIGRAAAIGARSPRSEVG
jgi:CIC family chloride channel protein